MVFSLVDNAPNPFVKWRNGSENDLMSNNLCLNTLVINTVHTTIKNSLQSSLPSFK